MEKLRDVIPGIAQLIQVEENIRNRKLSVKEEPEKVMVSNITRDGQTVIVFNEGRGLKTGIQSIPF